MSTTYDVGTQGGKWEIAIAVPVQNPKFRIPRVWNSTLAADRAAGSAILTFPAAAGVDTDIRCRFIPGNTLVVGPSTDSAYLGATEEVIIYTVDSGTQITPQYVTKFAYKSGDPISGYGEGIGDGWNFSSSIHTTNGNNRVRELEINTSPWAWGAEDDWYAQRWRAATLTPDVADVYQNIPKFRVTKEGVDATVKWRQGIWWKITPGASSTASLTSLITVTDGAGATTTHSLAIVSATGTASTSWRNVVEDDWALGRTGTLQLKYYVGNDSGATTPIAQIYHPFLEFELPWGGGTGYYQIPDYPDWGSVECERRGAMKSAILANNTLELTSGDGWQERNKKWQISAEFSNISQAVWNMLRRYENFQDRGFSLNLHCYIDDIPWSLTGHMTLFDLGKKGAFLSQHNFGFLFEEA